MNKKKICIVVNSRANYARIKSVLREIKAHPKLELQLIVGASAMLFRYGNAIDVIRADGFEPNAITYSIVEGENPATMAKSTGLGVIELASIFQNLSPDIVLTVADRFETIATAISASYMNIPVAHTQGGELTGSIDESVRHAVTKLSHIHFPATEAAGKIVQSLGENPESIFVTGCPAMDLLHDIDLSPSNDLFFKYKGVGKDVDLTKDYLVVLQHPVTTEYGEGFEQINSTLDAIKKIGINTIWLWPNVDAGSDHISKGLRQFRESNPTVPIHYSRNYSAEDYARLINNSLCLIGNSSSGIREASFLGVPSVNIGTRQSNRDCCENVVHATYSSEDIYNKIQQQLEHGRYKPSTLYGDGNAGKKISEILSNYEPKIQKKLFV